MRELGLMCMLALARPAPLDLFALRRAVAQVAPRSAVTIERRRAPPGETVLIVAVDGHPFVVHATPERLPERDYAEAVAGNLLWPDAGDAMAHHEASVAVCAAEREHGHGLLRAQAAALTRLAAAVSAAARALGAHWLGTGAMASPERLARAAGEIGRGQWPVDLWLGYRLTGGGRQGERPVIGAATVGARPYFGVEIEIPPYAAGETIEPIRILFGAAAALMASGEPVRDGLAVRVRGEEGRGFRLALDPARPGVARLETGGG